MTERKRLEGLGLRGELSIGFVRTYSGRQFMKYPNWIEWSATPGHPGLGVCRTSADIRD